MCVINLLKIRVYAQKISSCCKSNSNWWPRPHTRLGVLWGVALKLRNGIVYSGNFYFHIVPSAPSSNGRTVESLPKLSLNNLPLISLVTKPQCIVMQFLRYLAWRNCKVANWIQSNTCATKYQIHLVCVVVKNVGIKTKKPPKGLKCWGAGGNGVRHVVTGVGQFVVN